MNNIILKKFNGKVIDLCDEFSRYFLSMDKKYQLKWMSEFPLESNHDKQNIVFEFTSNTNSTYLYYFADNIEFNNPFIIKTNDKYVDYVGIFIPGKKYYWKVIDNITKEESDIDYFNTLDVPSRWISAGSVFNMRDIGGWISNNKCRVKYGLVYRGGQLSLDNKWEKSYMNEYSFKVFDYLGIKTEIELREGYNHELSQIRNDKNCICLNGIGYEQILTMTDLQKEQYRNLFKALGNINTYPIYFHCSWGADRTGVLAFLLSGLLGVSYDNICEDYELTSFSGSGRRSRIDFPWKDMVPELINKYGNIPFENLIHKYLIDYLNLTFEDINNIKNILLEEYIDKTIYHKVTYIVDNKKYVECNVIDGYQISMVEPGVYLDKYLKCWMNNNVEFDFNTKVSSDLVLDALFDNIIYEDYDTISISDLGFNEYYDLKEAKDFPYNFKSNNGSRMFSFDYKIEAFDNNFNDGVHVEIGKLWDYKAHVWFQDLNSIHLYTKKDTLSLSFRSNFEYSKTYRIDVGILIPKNTIKRGKQLLVLKINNKVFAIKDVNVDLSIHSIGLAGTKGILYNIKK